jgi:hypothetical protein
MDALDSSSWYARATEPSYVLISLPIVFRQFIMMWIVLRISKYYLFEVVIVLYS